MKAIYRRISIAILLALTAAPVITFAQNSNVAASASSASGSVAHATRKSINKANRALERRVLSALTKAKIDALNVTVLVKSGAVTLVGAVPDSSQINRAGDETKKVAGVTSVDNRLIASDKHQ